jgi:hypothetical protein
VCAGVLLLVRHGRWCFVVYVPRTPLALAPYIVCHGVNPRVASQSTEGHYCTVSCSGGTTINWHAHEDKWCAEHNGDCPPRPPLVPIDGYKLKLWSEVKRPPMACAVPATGVPKVTMAILAYKETESLMASLETYAKANVLQSMSETLLFLNGRTAEMDEVVKPYTVPPYNIRVMGNADNHGLTWAMNWLMGNASNDHVLFLEKDFQLVESGDCFHEQIATGVQMLKVRARVHVLRFTHVSSGAALAVSGVSASLGVCVVLTCVWHVSHVSQDGTAHVVRFRSRHNPGRPNWARILYKDHEDDVFKNQPNLLCNFFHWIDNPEKRWPEKFWGCGPGGAVDGAADRSKVFYCSKAFYCNWTNNPFLIHKRWWRDEYELRFHEAKVRCTPAWGACVVGAWVRRVCVRVRVHACVGLCVCARAYIFRACVCTATTLATLPSGYLAVAPASLTAMSAAACSRRIRTATWSTT